MKLSFKNSLDERFWRHRMRAGFFAGIAGAVVADLLLGYRYVYQHVWSWDLVIVMATIAIVGTGLFLWYRHKG